MAAAESQSLSTYLPALVQIVLGLSIPAIILIVSHAFGQRAHQGALAQWLEVEAITAGRMIDRLEKAGMVERRADPADRRAWRLFLTDGATPLLDELLACANDVFDEALQGFAEAERALLLALLERARANLLEDVPPERALAEKAAAHG
jgi:DNA-binding MarR family transcriptional regulator